MTYYDLNMNSKRINNTQDPASAQDVATKNYIDSILSGYMKQVKVERFTASGTWTVPAGVTYAVAHIRGGGGSVSTSIGSPTVTQGGDSSVAFTSGTITASGGASAPATYAESIVGTAGANNSGQGAFLYGGNGFGTVTVVLRGADGAEVVAGATVVAGSNIAVVVGAGGQGSRAGGSGYVWIEYY